MQLFVEPPTRPSTKKKSHETVQYTIGTIQQVYTLDVKASPTVEEVREAL
jgi:hypothetical protein